MRTFETIALTGLIALGAYAIFGKNKINDFLSGSDFPLSAGFPSGYSGTNILPTPTDFVINAKTQEIQPISKIDIFTPTTEKAADRFIIAKGSGGSGVYDRYAQQSIRKETATTRAIFGTPSMNIPSSNITKTTVSPTIKKLFTTGNKLPQSIQL